jgi:hypothetical protein
MAFDSADGNVKKVNGFVDKAAALSWLFTSPRFEVIERAILTISKHRGLIKSAEELISELLVGDYLADSIALLMAFHIAFDRKVISDLTYSAHQQRGLGDSSTSTTGSCTWHSQR